MDCECVIVAFFQKIKQHFHRDEPGQLKKELLWLLQRVNQYRSKILLIGLLGLFGTAMGLASSVASKYLLDAVTGYGSDLLKRSAVWMGVLMVGGLVFQAISGRISASVHIRVKMRCSM